MAYGSRSRGFADIDSHRAEQTVLIADAGESRAPHQFRDAALAGIALQRRRDVKVSVRIAVEEETHGRHHRVKKGLVQRGGDRIARLSEIQDDRASARS